MEIYFDNCSTTKARDEVIDEMIYYLKKEYGNPSSLHRMGFNVEKKVETIRESISNFLKVDKDEIYFTSGGTESNNLAIQGIINKYSRKGKHIITTSIEHPSVLNILKYYEERGYEITYLEVDINGLISLEELRKTIREDTILIAIMLVNNEIGSIQPIGEIKKVLKEVGSDVILHVDGVQAFGKIPVNIKNWGIDTFSFSGHKIHGPKGIGGLYVNKDIALEPIVFGGNQERGLRSGTENIPGIMGLGKAVEIMEKNYVNDLKKIGELKSYFINRLLNEIPYIHINSPMGENNSPYILNVSFEYTRGEVLLHYLEDKNIYVSTASACSSKGTEKSHVLEALELTELQREGAIRFCFSYENTIEEIDYTIEILKESIKEIREITMR
ncbi:MAG: cysteine desulfurase [Tissierellia bacterium]|nr:cysteine desulfurase [Tissierellia bacterium]